MILYKVRNWEKIYEVNRTREMKIMQWIALPVKLTSDGYTLIMEKESGPTIFGTFVAVLEVAALCDPRGTLVRSDGTPHTVDTLSRITRISKKYVEEMLNVCTRECKWFEAIDLEQGAGIPQVGAEKPQEGAGFLRYIHTDIPTDNTDSAAGSAESVLKISQQEIDQIYSLYPTKDINNENRATGKSNKDKEKIRAILKTQKYPLYEAMELYLKDKGATKGFLQNLSVFLNRLPGDDVLNDWRKRYRKQAPATVMPQPKPAEKPEPEEMAKPEDYEGIFDQVTKKMRSV